MESFKREIFKQLGNLFYVLASDQRVSLMASGELKMLLKKDWLTERGERSEDHVSEAAHLIGLSIDALQNEAVPAEVAFTDFTKFYTKHREQFSFALKQKILETSEGIVKVFANSGQVNIHLEELKKLLELSRQRTEVE
ncbi:MAG: hypothetical protein WEB30_04325 [Cyclobacteriaceae bacterium]